MLGTCFVVWFWCPFQFSNPLVEEERAGCFTCVVADCVLCLFHHDALGWFAVSNWSISWSNSLLLRKSSRFPSRLVNCMHLHESKKKEAVLFSRALNYIFPVGLCKNSLASNINR